MANAVEIREQLERFLSHKISLDEFEDWFAPNTWNIHKSGDADAQKLAYAIEHPLSMFEEESPELVMELTRIHGENLGPDLRSGDDFSLAGSYSERDRKA